VLRNVTYCSSGGVSMQMDIYLPSGQQGPAPAIVYVHGGSWISGDKWEIGTAGTELNSRGYVVASINYRLAPVYRWPAQIQDTKCAVRYLRANAARYNIDPNRIGAWGSSAGGHLVAMLGLAGPSAGLEGDGGWQDQSSSVKAVVDMFGPTDLTTFSPDSLAIGLGAAVFGVKPGQANPVITQASPVTYVTTGAPPFLIVQGLQDKLVPPSQSQELYDRLKADGDDATLVMVKNAGHGLAPTNPSVPIDPSSVQIRTTIEDFFDRTLGTTAPAYTFPATGKTVRGKFLQYWTSHGGLAQQGYPISDEMQETSATDGKTYTVQYFERAEFELHPENSPPNDVLLSLLGTLRYSQRYPNGAPGQAPNDSPGSVYFPQTGKHVGGRFLQYWNDHGGLTQQGYPISDEFTETSPVDGKPYRVQYFERAVFELHPENAPPNDVLLSLLGTLRLQSISGTATRP
jgi:acetyl esterase/lipase